MRNLTFLLADDDLDDTILFEQVLNEVAPSVTLITAKDGREAIDALTSGSASPDLIFLDLNMPKLNGKECLQFIKHTENLHKIPVIIYTTSSLSKDIEDCMVSGAACFITKPSGVKELTKIISTIVGSLPGGLEPALRKLSDSVNTFIVI